MKIYRQPTFHVISPRLCVRVPIFRDGVRSGLFVEQEPNNRENMEQDNTAQKMIAWMTRVEINEQTKQQLIAKLNELTKVNDSSMELYCKYYQIRVLLRKMAMIQYVTVIESYKDEGLDASFPEEGLSIIEQDVTETMLEFDWLHDGQQDNE